MANERAPEILNPDQSLEKEYEKEMDFLKKLPDTGLHGALASVSDYGWKRTQKEIKKYTTVNISAKDLNQLAEKTEFPRSAYRWAILVNAELRFDPEKEVLMQELMRESHSEMWSDAVGMRLAWRKHLSNLPLPIQRGINFLTNILDDVSTEYIIDDDSLTPQHFIGFFGIQKDIAQAKIKILEKDKDIDSKTKNKEIALLMGEIELYQDLIGKIKSKNRFETAKTNVKKREEEEKLEIKKEKVLKELEIFKKDFRWTEAKYQQEKKRYEKKLGIKLS